MTRKMFWSSSTLHGAVIAKREFESVHLVSDLCSLIYSSLAPKYEELAQLYVSNPSYAEKVTIAKVDATANDVPEEIQGFPTIKLYPAGAKDSPVDYSGGRTVQDLAEFVKVNGKHKVDAYGSNDTKDDVDTPDAATTMSKQAPAATTTGGVKESIKDGAEEAVQGSAEEAVKNVASGAAQAVKSAVVDSEEAGVADHDEL